MYAVAVSRDFVAQHFLIGGDWGAENESHSHHYRVEVGLEGATPVDGEDTPAEPAGCAESSSETVCSRLTLTTRLSPRVIVTTS